METTTQTRTVIDLFTDQGFVTPTEKAMFVHLEPILSRAQKPTIIPYGICFINYSLLIKDEIEPTTLMFSEHSEERFVEKATQAFLARGELIYVRTPSSEYHQKGLEYFLSLVAENYTIPNVTGIPLVDDTFNNGKEFSMSLETLVDNLPYYIANIALAGINNPNKSTLWTEENTDTRYPGIYTSTFIYNGASNGNQAQTNGHVKPFTHHTGHSSEIMFHIGGPLDTLLRVD